jgi:hypothetical protein
MPVIVHVDDLCTEHQVLFQLWFQLGLLTVNLPPPLSVTWGGPLPGDSQLGLGWGLASPRAPRAPGPGFPMSWWRDHISNTFFTRCGIAPVHGQASGFALTGLQSEGGDRPLSQIISTPLHGTCFGHLGGPSKKLESAWGQPPVPLWWV